MECARSFPTSVALRSFSSSARQLLVCHRRPASLIFPIQPALSRSTLALARRRNSGSAITSSSSSSSSSSSKKNKKKLPRNKDREEDMDDDAFEALFKQLEEDLKNEDPSIDYTDDEITEEDLIMLERELTKALGGDDIEVSNLAADARDSDHDADEDDAKEDEGEEGEGEEGEGEEDEGEEDEGEEDEGEEDEEPVKLKYWQLRRLSSALKTGRRKTSIKNLAAELSLDRAIVLQMLRDPPPSLVMMSATLPDEPAPVVAVSENKPMQIVPVEATVSAAEPETKVTVPVHVMQQGWSAQKRLKKVHLDTLERVYRRTKRPTNAMISSIVQVTNLPRKTVVKWFEDKRTEDGVPENRQPYQRNIV